LMGIIHFASLWFGFKTPLSPPPPFLQSHSASMA
jgi:hypothetical protein